MPNFHKSNSDYLNNDQNNFLQYLNSEKNMNSQINISNKNSSSFPKISSQENCFIPLPRTTSTNTSSLSAPQGASSTKKTPPKKKFCFKNFKKETCTSLNEVEYFLNNFSEFMKYVKLIKLLK